jgi:hypothetical protein
MIFHNDGSGLGLGVVSQAQLAKTEDDLRREQRSSPLVFKTLFVWTRIWRVIKKEQVSKRRVQPSAVPSTSTIPRTRNDGVKLHI